MCYCIKRRQISFLSELLSYKSARMREAWRCIFRDDFRDEMISEEISGILNGQILTQDDSKVATFQFEQYIK